VIWSVHNGQPLLPIHEAKSSNIYRVQFNPEGDLLFTSDVAGTVAIWDAHSGRGLSSDLQMSAAIYEASIRPRWTKGTLDCSAARIGSLGARV
jgi:hypothetical protein